MPFRILRLVIVSAALLTLHGCATMSPQQCLLADWYQRGYQDGRSGYRLSRIADHGEACSEVGVVPDTQQYRRGHDEGLKYYCTPANALEEGRQGHSYRQVCPPATEAEFVHFYRLGKAVHDAQEQLDELDRRARRLERELRDADKGSDKRRSRRELRALDTDLRHARDRVRDARRRARLY